MSFELRPARANDAWMLRKKVLLAKLDPTQLRWSQFWVVEVEGNIVACGQLRQFPEALELGSVVVDRPWRNRGLGSAIVKHLIDEADRPLYLECLGRRLAQFYRRFGFVEMPWQELPLSLQAKFRISYWAKIGFGLPAIFMQYDATVCGRSYPIR